MELRFHLIHQNCPIYRSRKACYQDYDNL